MNPPFRVTGITGLENITTRNIQYNQYRTNQSCHGTVTNAPEWREVNVCKWTTSCVKTVRNIPMTLFLVKKTRQTDGQCIFRKGSGT